MQECITVMFSQCQCYLIMFVCDTIVRLTYLNHNSGLLCSVVLFANRKCSLWKILEFGFQNGVGTLLNVVSDVTNVGVTWCGN